MSYVIIHASTLSELQHYVDAALDEGYRPIGGIAVAVCPGGIIMYQAMFRESN